RKAVGAVAFLGLSVVEARGVHAHAASLALPAAGMDFHGDALADLELVDMGPKRYDSAHIFMAGREILVEGQTALNAGWQSPMDDFQVSGADRDCIDANQHFGPSRYR